MARFQAVYYCDAEGREPVDEFIDSIPAAHQVALDDSIAMLNTLSPKRPHLRFPHSSQVEGELRELRCHYGSTLYRILYRRSEKLIVLLHAFEKKTGKILKRDIETAKKRFADLKQRMAEHPRRPPRAIGHDAP